MFYGNQHDSTYEKRLRECERLLVKYKEMIRDMEVTNRALLQQLADHRSRTR